MELFGIGGTELIAILIIMLVVAGPKRMIRWAYILGQYTAKIRSMWAETMAVVQKEFDAAGMDITVPKTIPTRNSLVSQMNNALSGMTRPVQAVIDEVKTEVLDAQTALKVED
jgi:Sec-independent protein translocase protein TatA